MNSSEKSQLRIYQFMDDSPAFSVCELNGATHPGNCCNPVCREKMWQKLYYCGNEGIHFHCHKHINMPLYRRKAITEKVEDEAGIFDEPHEKWWCDKCATENEDYRGHDFDEKEHMRRARAFAASDEYKNAKVARIDDQLVQIEFKKVKTPKGQSDYYSAWGNIETDKDGNPQLNLYIALKSMSGKKAHYFIEPELGRLREEVRGLDISPEEIISKIEITMRKTRMSKEYINDEQ